MIIAEGKIYLCPYENLQYFATEILKVKNVLPLIIVKVFNFQENKSYNCGSGIHLPRRNMHTAY